jgi:tetratricopeptide (TPR) repeat protein
MSDEVSKQRATILFERAYRHQIKGEFADAIILYKRYLAVQPTAEAHTYMGWTSSMMNRYEEAIACRKHAIEVDPTFGNPYNDICAYPIEMDQLDEAVLWLERATKAERYDSQHFPYMNIGRVYEYKGRLKTTLTHFDRA